MYSIKEKWLHGYKDTQTLHKLGLTPTMSVTKSVTKCNHNCVLVTNEVGTGLSAEGLLA